MRIIHILALTLLLAGLACLSSVFGQEAKSSASESLASLRARAEKGDADAQFELGFMYNLGQEVPRDFTEALRWLRKAADQGQPRAQLNVALMYYIGQEVPQDFTEAARWYRKAADQGAVIAQSSLGAMYAKGQGVTQDYVEAHMWINLAASLASGDQQKRYADQREELARKMPPQQIAEAQRRAREWKPKTAQESKSPTPK